MESERERELREVPIQPIDKSKWPTGVRYIAQDELDAIGVDKDGLLYWHGKPVQIRQIFELRWYELGLATLATIGTVMQGVAAMFPMVPDIVKRLFS